MRVVLYGYTNNKKIQAIKGIRCATGFGLKESKDIADALDHGTEQAIEVDPAGALDLSEHGVSWRAAPSIPLSEFIAALGEYPAGIRVGDLVRVLTVVEKAA